VVDYVFNTAAPIVPEDPDTADLTVDVVGSGSVTATPDQPTLCDDSVQLEAVPDPGWSFDSWSGDAGGTDNPVTVPVSGSVAVTATFVEDGGGDPPPPPPDPSALVSDDFNVCALDGAVWSFVDPVGDASLSVNGSQLELSVPGGVAHDVWTGGNFAPRVMQSVSDEDFEVEVKFESTVADSFEMQGLIIEESASEFLRIDFYGNGGQPYAFVARFAGGQPTVVANVPVTVGASPYLRVGRVGDQWTVESSGDGSSWSTVASFASALTVSEVGVFAGNAGAAPAHTAVVDYVFNTAAPIVPEDPDTVTCN
jgi:hypothetical protein